MSLSDFILTAYAKQFKNSNCIHKGIKLQCTTRRSQKYIDTMYNDYDE